MLVVSTAVPCGRAALFRSAEVSEVTYPWMQIGTGPLTCSISEPDSPPEGENSNTYTKELNFSWNLLGTALFTNINFRCTTLQYNICTLLCAHDPNLVSFHHLVFHLLRSLHPPCPSLPTGKHHAVVCTRSLGFFVCFGCSFVAFPTYEWHHTILVLFHLTYFT